MRTLTQFLIALALLFSAALCAEERLLREGLYHAQVGDYIVTAQNRTCTVMLISDKGQNRLVIEEISIPESCFPRGINSWRAWVEKSAPGHTSWIAYAIAPDSGKILESYSYSNQCFCSARQEESFLGTLLNLRLHPVEDRHRRRVGPLPAQRHLDARPFWSPRLVVEGQIVPNAALKPWKTRWPNDGSELAGKVIEVYLPQKTGPYPSYFPYWLQVSGVVGKAKMRIIDAGMSLSSPQPPMPQRPLGFLNNGQMTQEGLRLWLITRPYYGSGYHLEAVEVSEEKANIPLKYSLQKTDEESILLVTVPQEELRSKLREKGRYLFVMKSWQQPKNAAQTTAPLTYLP